MYLQPGEKYVVVRQLSDPYDSNTYYVKAIIRDSKTDEVIDTLQLVNKTGQRFTKEWQVTADPSGLGRWIDVETTVYTDSGYTTISTLYQKESRTLLVQDRFSNTGNGGGADVDYKKVREIMKSEIEKIDFPKVRFDSINEKIKELKDVVETMAQNNSSMMKSMSGDMMKRNAIEGVAKSNEIEAIKKDIFARLNEIELAIDEKFSIEDLDERDEKKGAEMTLKVDGVNMSIKELKDGLMAVLTEIKGYTGESKTMSEAFNKAVNAINAIGSIKDYNESVKKIDEVKVKDDEDVEVLPKINRKRKVKWITQ